MFLNKNTAVDITTAVWNKRYKGYEFFQPFTPPKATPAMMYFERNM